jgi:hypothetical protein
MPTRRDASFGAIALAGLAAGTTAATAQGMRPERRMEVHPNLLRAINALQAARADLERAPHDFGGHKMDAMQAIDRAIEQLRFAMQFDR